MVVNCNLVMLFIGTLDDSSALDFNNSSQVPRYSHYFEEHNQGLPVSKYDLVAL